MESERKRKKKLALLPTPRNKKLLHKYLKALHKILKWFFGAINEKLALAV